MRRLDRGKRRIKGERFCPRCGESLESEFSKVKTKEDLKGLFADKCKERGMELNSSESRGG